MRMKMSVKQGCIQMVCVWLWCIVKRTNEHLHGPNIQLISCLETNIGLKRKAQYAQASTHYIIGESVTMISKGAAAKLPKLESLKRTIRRQRQITNNVQHQHISLEDFEISEQYQRTNKGDPFLLFDSGKQPQSLFAQVCVIHALRGEPNPFEDDYLLPSLIVLLPNKTEAYIFENVGAGKTLS